MGAVATVGVALLVAIGLFQVGFVIAAKHQAQAAADLAALAGSAATLRGDDGCAVAKAVVRRNRAALEQCRTDLAVVTVRVVKASAPVVGTRFHARADARAAPDFYVSPAKGEASRSSRSSRRTAPALSSGSFPLPHFGDWMHEGHPDTQPQSAIRSRVIPSQRSAIR